MTSQELRAKYLSFFEKNGHKIVPSAPLVPENDPTVLFTTAGMHPLIPYLLGEPHPLGKRLVSVQKCLRTVDIDEVGDTFHHTFFEMLGNWSIGDYFKKDAITWSFEFLTKELNIDQQKLSVSVFEGDSDAPRDEESAGIWKSLGFSENKIFYFPKAENWWGPPGTTGPCGPDTEIYYDTGKPVCSSGCRPGCPNNCGKFFEIWNNVFMEYFKNKDGKYEQLKQKNVDTGMGVERTVAILNGFSDNYQTDLFLPLIQLIEKETKKPYAEEANKRAIRVIADHLRAAVFLLHDGVIPSNKERGYILRRLIRRGVVKIHELNNTLDPKILVEKIGQEVLKTYHNLYFDLEKDKHIMLPSLIEEVRKFQTTLEKGLKEIEKVDKLDGKIAFDLYQSFGFPLELTMELARQKGGEIDLTEFQKEFNGHKELSRTASGGMFKGGLADSGENATKLHTATHLLHQALRKVLGLHVAQKGSNINAERLRFDFSHPIKLGNEELEKIENMVNEKIYENLPVTITTKSLEEAKKEGALAFFAEKYGEQVKVYKIGKFSKEVCGGPHVSFTGELKSFKIIKEEGAGAGIRRIYAKVG